MPFIIILTEQQNISIYLVMRRGKVSGSSCYMNDIVDNVTDPVKYYTTFITFTKNHYHIIIY